MQKNPRKERPKQKRQCERDPIRTRSGKFKRTKSKNAERAFAKDDDDDDIRIISVQRILVAYRATELVFMACKSTIYTLIPR